MNNNKHTKFTIDIKDISADKEIKLEKNEKNSSIGFNPNDPEGNFSLDLAESFS